MNHLRRATDTHLTSPFSRSLVNKIHVKHMTQKQMTLVPIVGDESVAKPPHSKSGPSSVATIHRRSDMPLPPRLAKALHRHAVNVSQASSHSNHVITSQLHQPISVRRRTLLLKPEVHGLQKVKGRFLLCVAFHVMAGRPVAARLTWLSGFTKRLSTLDCWPVRHRQPCCARRHQQLKQYKVIDSVVIELCDVINGPYTRHFFFFLVD